MRLGLLDAATAQGRGYDMTEWNKLHDKVQKFINDFVKLGGDRANIENAIKHGAKGISGIGCPHIGEEPVTAAAGIAAATPIVLLTVKAITAAIDAEKAAMHTIPEREAALQSPVSYSSDDLNQIQQGANALAQDGGISHPFPGKGIPGKPGGFKALLTPKNLIIGGVIVGGGYLLLADD